MMSQKKFGARPRHMDVVRMFSLFLQPARRPSLDSLLFLKLKGNENHKKLLYLERVKQICELWLGFRCSAT
jgi:hypothetical protein